MGSPATPYLQVMKGSRTYFWNYGTPSISWERLKLETSNLARILTTMGTNENNATLGQRGSRGVMSPTLCILGPPPYLGNG